MRPDSVAHLPLTTLFIMHHTHSVTVLSSTTPSVLSVTPPSASHIVKPVHQLFGHTVRSVLSQLCPRILTL